MHVKVKLSIQKKLKIIFKNLTKLTLKFRFELKTSLWENADIKLAKFTLHSFHFNLRILEKKRMKNKKKTR